MKEDHALDGERPSGTAAERTGLLTASSSCKVLGEFVDASGTGVLGKNTAGSGTPIGVEGAVPNTSGGYGLSTPDDARVGGTAEATALAGGVTGGNRVTDLVGPGLSLSSGALGLPTSASDGQILKWDSGSAIWTLADDTQAGAGAGLSYDGSGNLDVNAGNGLAVNSDSLDVSAGDGLTIDSGSVALTQSGLAGQILKYDGSSWYLAADNDTHTGVSDDGTSVYSNVDDINFGSDFAVTDDGGETVTTSLANDSVMINAGNHLSGGGSVSLGGSTTVDVQPTGAEVYLSGDRNYSNSGTWETVGFDTVVADDGSGFSSPSYTTPSSGDYQVDVNLNWWELDATLLEARLITGGGTTLMYSKTATPQANESIEMSKVLKDVPGGTTMQVQVKYDGTGTMNGGARAYSTWSVNKVA